MNKAEKKNYSTFQFLIDGQGEEIFNAWIWNKIQTAERHDTEEDDITTAELFRRRFEEYCQPKRNVIVERRKLLLEKSVK